MPLTSSPVFLFKPFYELIDEPLVYGIWSLSFRQFVGLKVLAIGLVQQNDELADKDLNLRLIIDGVVYNSATPITFVNGTPQFLYLTVFEDEVHTDPTLVLPYNDEAGHMLPLECGSLQVLVGLDSVAGTNQRYTLWIRWLGAG